MANWAFIEDNEIKEKYDILPDSWRNISNFFVLQNDTEFLRTLNWVQIKHLEYDYDPTKQKLDNVRYIVDGLDVTEVYDVVDIPEHQVNVSDIEKMLTEETQNRLDNFARTRGYDNILSACSYFNDPNKQFRTEGQYCLQMRSETWVTLNTMLQNIKNGTMQLPLRFSDIENSLPKLVWPEPIIETLINTDSNTEVNSNDNQVIEPTV